MDPTNTLNAMRNSPTQKKKATGEIRISLVPRISLPPLPSLKLHISYLYSRNSWFFIRPLISSAFPSLKDLYSYRRTLLYACEGVHHIVVLWEAVDMYARYAWISFHDQKSNWQWFLLFGSDCDSSSWLDRRTLNIPTYDSEPPLLIMPSTIMHWPP